MTRKSYMPIRAFSSALLVSASLLAFGAAPALANPMIQLAYDDGETNAKSAEVLRIMHITNVSEVRLGKLALKKGQSKAARAYGQMIATDHRKMDVYVLAVAKAKGVAMSSESFGPVAQTLQAKNEQAYQKLAATPIERFDNALAQNGIKGHSEGIAVLSKARAKLADTDVIKLIDAALPVLKKHEAMARKILGE